MTLLVQAANVRYAHGGNQLFQDVSFEVRAGDRVALIGENGAGKSTFSRTHKTDRVVIHRWTDRDDTAIAAD